MLDEILPCSLTVCYVIDGDPTPLARARVGKGRVWDSQKQTKMFWRVNLERMHGERPLFTGPLHVEMNFYMPMPKAAHKRWDQMVNSYHLFRPDLSNLIKFIEDVATGVLYRDDCIISSIWSKKRYDKIPRTEFIITEMKNEK